MRTSRRGNRPFRISRRNLSRPRNVGKNGHFGKGKPVVSPEGRIVFLRHRNVQKWSLRKVEPDGLLFRNNIFSGVETSRRMFISRTASRPFRRRREYAFSGSKTSKNCHFATGKPAVCFSETQYFSLAETSEKWSFREG